VGIRMPPNKVHAFPLDSEEKGIFFGFNEKIDNERCLSYASLSYVKLIPMSLTYVSLTYISLSYASLNYASLSYISLTFVSLTYVSLTYSKTSTQLVTLLLLVVIGTLKLPAKIGYYKHMKKT